MRRRSIFITAVAAVLLIAGVALYRFRLKKPISSPSADTKQSSTSVPPFSTREPESYQATRVITFTEAAPENIDVAAPQRVTRILLARFGEQRREEYEAGPSGTIVYLENAGGRFVLLPQAKLYADANNADTVSALAIARNEAETTSPDLLLNSPRAATHYQKLVAEVIDGRVATRYRVTTNSAGNNENFIWVDEQLGMPVASRYTSTNANRSTRVSIDLKDISTEVDPLMFVLPADYRKVAASELLDLIRAQKAVPALQDDRK
ncbi:MAG: hypothetical protein M3447_02030 [Acidobacteriota bacterium]|nr:hypothetical protein [Acidobacteriota bacterium]